MFTEVSPQSLTDVAGFEIKQYNLMVLVSNIHAFVVHLIMLYLILGLSYRKLDFSNNHKNIFHETRDKRNDRISM